MWDRVFRLVMTTADDSLDPRRRRIRFRAWHRGMREMDLIMGRFVDSQLSSLSEAEVDDLETLMEAPDRDVFAWLSGEVDAPSNYATPLFHRLKAFHTHAGPLHR